jgi:hypothetical protein
MSLGIPQVGPAFSHDRNGRSGRLVEIAQNAADSGWHNACMTNLDIMKSPHLLNRFTPIRRPIALALASLLFSVTAAFAQCGKDVVLTSSKTEYLNAEGAVQRTVEEESVIRIDKSKVTITPSGHDAMIGAVLATTCEWKEPFKTGKTIIEAKFIKEGEGTESNATITIEGKDGKITCSMKQQERPDRIIRVTVEKFEEQKTASKN